MMSVHDTARFRRVAIVRGQDRSRWTDFYHLVLTTPWWSFFLGLAAVFFLVNALFALAYLADPGGIVHARPGSFWDDFFFSIQTFATIGYGVMAPKSFYANIVVSIEAFFGVVGFALATGIIFARFSRPTARVMFSKVAVVAMLDGVPTLMFRAANQRGNRILEATASISIARQVCSSEGVVMRRFEDLKLVRERTLLFALSWTVMHRIDESSPLHGATPQSLVDNGAELIVLLSGTDESLADRIYARAAYGAADILWDRRFVDVLSLAPDGRMQVDLHHFHDTEAIVS